MDPLAGGPSPYRLLYRLVGDDELNLVKRARAAAGGKPQVISHLEDILEAQMQDLLGQDDLGEVLHTHTMTSIGGGSIGGDQALVSMFSDFESLAASTDDQVRTILQNAPYVLTFQVPRQAALDAPSDLSRSESEVIVPNDLQALSATLIDITANPYRGAGSGK